MTHDNGLSSSLRFRENTWKVEIGFVKGASELYVPARTKIGTSKHTLFTTNNPSVWVYVNVLIS